MTTAMYRVVRVLSAESSPVARIQAVDAEGHELRLEVPVAALDVKANQVLVLQWSAHAVPAAFTESQADEPQVSLETSGTIDEQFMELMASTGRDAPATQPPIFATPASGFRKPAADRGIEVEFNTLLGMAQRKGQRDGR